MPEKYTYADSLPALAKALKVGLTPLKAYAKKGCPLRKYRKGYRVETVRKWVDRYAGRNPEASKDTARLLSARARERDAKASMAELKLRAETGEYIPLAEVKERDRQRIAAVRRGLLGFPKALAPHLAGMSPPEIEQVLAKRVRELLLRFSQM